MACTAATAPADPAEASEALFFFPENRRPGRDTGASASWESRMAVILKRACFQSVLVTTTPATPKGAVWVLEQIILGAQVGARCSGWPCCSVTLVIMSPLPRNSPQLLSYPLSATPALLWQRTILNTPSTIVSYLSLYGLGGGLLEFVLFLALFLVSITTLIGYILMGHVSGPGKTLPALIVLVRAPSQCLCACMGGRAPHTVVTDTDSD